MRSGTRRWFFLVCGALTGLPDDRHADVARGSNNSERLVRTGQRECRDVVGTRVGEDADLGRVVGVAQRFEQTDGAAVEVGELFRRVSDPAPPSRDSRARSAYPARCLRLDRARCGCTARSSGAARPRRPSA